MDNERTILGSAIVIAGIGALEYMLSDTPDNRALVIRLGGAAGIAVLLSAFAALGPGPGKVAAGLAVLTAVTAFFIDSPTIFGFTQSIGQGGQSGGITPGFHGPNTGKPIGELEH